MKPLLVHIPDEKSHGALGTRRRSREEKKAIFVFPAILGQGSPSVVRNHRSQKEGYLDAATVAFVYRSLGPVDQKIVSAENALPPSVVDCA